MRKRQINICLHATTLLTTSHLRKIALWRIRERRNQLACNSDIKMLGHHIFREIACLTEQFRAELPAQDRCQHQRSAALWGEFHEPSLDQQTHTVGYLQLVHIHGRLPAITNLLDFSLKNKRTNSLADEKWVALCLPVDFCGKYRSHIVSGDVYQQLQYLLLC